MSDMKMREEEEEEEEEDHDHVFSPCFKEEPFTQALLGNMKLHSR